MTVSSAVTHSSSSFISVLACLETYLNHSHSPHSFYLVLCSGQRSILSCCNVFPLHFQHVHVHIYRRDATHCANFPTSGWKLEDSIKTKELTNNAKLFLVLPPALHSSLPQEIFSLGKKKWLFYGLVKSFLLTNPCWKKKNKSKWHVFIIKIYSGFQHINRKTM